MIRRVLVVLVLLFAFPEVALAAGTERTAISIAVPPRAAVGQVAEVQAKLTDASGAAIAKALVLFTTKLSFLEGESDVVLADARTDATGLAVADIDLRTDGSLQITAVFQGDDRYAGAKATALIEVASSGQVYEQQAGVKLPGINEAPTVVAGTPSVGLLQSFSRFWPALSGWPVALVLMIIWSFYGAVVVLLFRIVSAAKATGR